MPAAASSTTIAAKRSGRARTAAPARAAPRPVARSHGGALQDTSPISDRNSQKTPRSNSSGRRTRKRKRSISAPAWNGSGTRARRGNDRRSPDEEFPEVNAGAQSRRTGRERRLELYANAHTGVSLVKHGGMA